MYKAKERYNQLSTARSQFLDRAVECSELTLPHLIVDDLGVRPSKRKLTTPGNRWEVKLL